MAYEKRPHQENVCVECSALTEIVLRDGEKPDIVVVEFAVNDEGDETKGDCYESLVRKILKLDWNPAVVLLFSVFANDWNLQDRLSPVGRLYDLPMVSIKDTVVEQFTKKPNEGRVQTKNQFFYDNVSSEVARMKHIVKELIFCQNPSLVRFLCKLLHYGILDTDHRQIIQSADRT